MTIDKIYEIQSVINDIVNDLEKGKIDEKQAIEEIKGELQTIKEGENDNG